MALCRQVLGITTGGRLAVLGGSVVVAGINAVDTIKRIDGIANSLSKGSDGILVFTLGNNAIDYLLEIRNVSCHIVH